MYVLDQFGSFFGLLGGLVWNPSNLIVLFLASLLGILFGALPGLTATLGVALLTTLTYGMPFQTALIALLALYVGAIYGGSYPSILVNIPGTAASAATAMDGYPMAARGEGGKALGLTTTASFIGTVMGMIVLVIAAPLIAQLALQFTSVEFFLLAFFGIIISGTLTSSDLAIKGWIAGLLGLALSVVGRDQLQFYPRYTFGLPELDSGIRYLREATRRKPTHAVMRSDLGFALMQAGDYDAAMLELSTAVELDVSGGARARNNLILLMLVQDKEKDAVRLAARAGLDETALNGLRAKAEQMQARRRRAEPAEESTDASESDASTPPPAS